MKMTGSKYVFIEEIVDRHGITRIYGYDRDMRKYFVNLHEVVQTYKKRGLEGFRNIT